MAGTGFDLVVCSLEPWDEIWRRNQLLVSELMTSGAAERVLFVEPPYDLLGDGLRRRRRPRLSGPNLVGSGLWTFRPFRVLPARLGPVGELLVAAQVWRVSRRVGFSDPILWVNDLRAEVLRSCTQWPSVYDITDDWLLADASPSEAAARRRLDGALVERCDEVVVCSEALHRSRSAVRPIHLIPNAVDTLSFTTPQPRPDDLPPAPVAVYVGTLHDERLDVALIERLAVAGDAKVVLVGPSSLTERSQTRLVDSGVQLLGSRAHTRVPAYLQHADVVIVPHMMSPFTESLDPIKAYECLAVGTVTVATPVPGFTGAGGCIRTATPDHFVAAVREALEERPARSPSPTPSWTDRAEAMAGVLGAARAKARTRTLPWPIWTPTRIAATLGRRLRLALARARFRNIELGAGCDVRNGVRIWVGPRGSLRIGRGCVLDRHLSIEAHGHVRIGDRVILGHSVTIGAVESVLIADDCLIGEQVSIRDHDHAFAGEGPVREQGHRSAPVSIGRGAWLGGKVTVLAGTCIGEKAVIGAGSVVTKNVPAESVAAGVPARIISQTK